MTHQATPTDDEIECTKKRTLGGAARAVRALLIAIGRDYRTCGKAACARSRRCRGFACEPEPGRDDVRQA